MKLRKGRTLEQGSSNRFFIEKKDFLKDTTSTNPQLKKPSQIMETRKPVKSMEVRKVHKKEALEAKLKEKTIRDNNLVKDLREMYQGKNNLTRILRGWNLHNKATISSDDFQSLVR